MEDSLPGSMIAPCGIPCNACRAFLRKRNPCPGCRAPDDQKPETRVVCRIKTCPEFMAGNFSFCSECTIFACDRLLKLEKRYVTRYNLSPVENLKAIRDSGIGAFEKADAARRTCAACGGTVCIHTGICAGCGVWKESGNSGNGK